MALEMDIESSPNLIKRRINCPLLSDRLRRRLQSAINRFIYLLAPLASGASYTRGDG